MRQITLMLAAAMILGAAAGAIGVRTLGAQQEAEKRTVLVTTDLVDVRNRVQLCPGRLVDPRKGGRTTGQHESW